MSHSNPNFNPNSPNPYKDSPLNSFNLSFRIKNHLAYQLGSKLIDYDKQRKQHLMLKNNNNPFLNLYNFIRVGGGGNIFINLPL